MADQKKMVEAITPMEEDFAKWYTDIVKKAELMDYTSVRGCMVIEPYGFALWENIRDNLDARFKELGHENVSMPMFIPESLLQKEKDHVEGFAPEVAWVTKAATKSWRSPLCVRPTLRNHHLQHVRKMAALLQAAAVFIQPVVLCCALGKTTRPFLRTSEFLWQEGHTLHETPEEAQEETMQMLNIYREVAEDIMATSSLS